MATQLTPGPAARAGAGVARLTGTLAAGALVVASAVLFASSVAPTLTSRYLPWITGRSLGLAAYASLTALVGLGIVMRHPRRSRLRLHPESLLRAHAALGTSTVLLALAHAGFLASDRYAGVGWVGAVVPGLAHYRPAAVALGTVALFLLLAVAGTARFAGRPGARHWLAYHRLAGLTFAAVWLHGVLAGTDTAALRLGYIGTGAAVLVLAASRALARSGEKVVTP